MAPEVVKCPNCGQSLGIQSYVVAGTEVVCANAACLSTLRITQRRPLRVELVPIEQTFNANDRPESYG